MLWLVIAPQQPVLCFRDYLVCCVQGMYWESQGQPEHLAQAEQLYKDMLADQPSCTMAAKRLVRA